VAGERDARPMSRAGAARGEDGRGRGGKQLPARGGRASTGSCEVLTTADGDGASSGNALSWSGSPQERRRRSQSLRPG
jgi:hypothetical protein